MWIVVTAAVALASLGALWLAPSAAADPPTWTSFMSDISGVAPTPTSGVVETWSDPGATDDNGTPTVGCSPSSGTTFMPGTTGVTCTATDTVSGESVTQSFNVIITVAPDTTPPVVTVPSSMTVEAAGPGGAVATYSASAVDDFDGSVTVNCDHSSGSTFPLGATTVTCSATDTAGNTGTASFSVTVVDTTPPVVTVPSDITVHATGPNGAPVAYAASAVDLVDGPRAVNCDRPSGSTFPIGPTTVTCSATDTVPNTGSASFIVTVVSTKGPGITPPDPITVRATGPNGVPATDPAVARFLAGSSGNDGFGGAVKISSDAPAIFPIGTTKVTFRATDSRGNTASATSTVTVTTAPVVAPKAVDTTPPDNVAALTGALGSRSVILRWQNPKAADFDHVEILRGFDKGPAPHVVVYSGSADLFRDSSLRNGTAYRYLIVAVDHVGNRSAGIAVVAKPGAPQLVRPVDGASLKTLPTLLWVPAAKATYYNVQLYRGNVKVLSVWPGKNSLTLGRRWTYRGKTVTLKPGVYHWFVWPGLGNYSSRRYGALLGGATFTVTA